MRFGVIVSNMQRKLVERLNALVELAVKADELGYDSFLVTDHYMLPWGDETLEPWVFLSYLAAKTKRIRLGTCVTPITLRPPSLLAKIVSSLDLLSNGRAVLGAGIGWYQPEFEAYSSWEPFSERAEKVSEAFELIKKLWTEEKVTFLGKHYVAKDAVLLPKPLQKPHPPIWFGGWSSRALELTARFGDGWVPIGPRWAPVYVTPDEYGEKAEQIRSRLRELGRAEDEFVFACAIAPQPSIDSFVKEIEQYVDAGMNYLVLGVPKIDYGVEDLKRFVEEVAPSFA